MSRTLTASDDAIFDRFLELCADDGTATLKELDVALADDGLTVPADALREALGGGEGSPMRAATVRDSAGEPVRRGGFLAWKPVGV